MVKHNISGDLSSHTYEPHIQNNSNSVFLKSHDENTMTERATARKQHNHQQQTPTTVTTKTSQMSATKSKWMNPRPKDKSPYSPTDFEHYANIITHGLAVLPAVLCATSLVNYSRTQLQYYVSMLYGTSLIMLFSVSTLYHLLSHIYSSKKSKWREFFHYCDRSTIYIFIASSYSPWLSLRATTNADTGGYMLWGIWIGAFLGMAYQIVFHEKYKILEVVFYLMIGVCPSIVVIDMVDTSGLVELAIGGALYVTGVFFFRSDGRIPFAHAIWHILVSIAAYVHFYAIFTYLYYH